MNWNYIKHHNHKRPGSIYLLTLMIFVLLSISLTGIFQSVNQRSRIAANEIDKIQSHYIAESLVNQIIYDPGQISKLSSTYIEKVLGEKQDYVPIDTSDLVPLLDENITHATLRSRAKSSFDYVLRLQIDNRKIEVAIPFYYPPEETESKDLLYYWQEVEEWIKSSQAKVYDQDYIHLFEKNTLQMVSFSDGQMITSKAGYQSLPLFMPSLEDDSLEGESEDHLEKESLSEFNSENPVQREPCLNGETESELQTETEVEIEDQSNLEIEAEGIDEILNDFPEETTTETMTESITSEALQDPYAIDSRQSLLLDNKVDLIGVFRLSGQVQVRGIVKLKGVVLFRDVTWVFEPGSKLYIGGLLVPRFDHPNISYQELPKYSDPYLKQGAPSSLPQAGNPIIREVP